LAKEDGALGGRGVEANEANLVIELWAKFGKTVKVILSKSKKVLGNSAEN